MRQSGRKVVVVVKHKAVVAGLIFNISACTVTRLPILYTALLCSALLCSALLSLREPAKPSRQLIMLSR
jgi:hypothetical protein